MGTWVTCPECFQNLPRKFKNKKERKEVHDATCNGCKNKIARKHYEVGVKRGIWLKKWNRAVNAFSKAVNEFEKINDSKSMLTIELMRLMSEFNRDKNKESAQKVINEFISGRYNGFLNKDFIIPEFRHFDPLYYESKGWNEYFKINQIQGVFEKVSQMKTTSREFFNMGYDTIFFSTHIMDKSMTNVEIALGLEAESEELLGFHYASQGDIDNASIHLNNATITYINLEQFIKARQLKMVRQSLRMETACWICGARNQGYRQTFNFKYTGLNESHFNRVISLLKQRQEKNPSLYNDTIYTTKKPIAVIQEQDIRDKKNKEGIYLSTCTVCQGLLDELSKDVVEEALIPVWNSIHSLEGVITELISRINTMQSQINQLISVSHRH